MRHVKKIMNLYEIYHVGMINPLGHLIAGGFKPGVKFQLDEQKVRMIYMQMQLDFNMRQELDEILGLVDYIASRRKKQLIISVPIREFGSNLCKRRCR